MSELRDSSLTIYEALQNIKTGKYVMPAFQRQFVWNMEQIEKLWDSILLNYPIATFLFWHVDKSNVTEDTYFCNFLHEVAFDSRKAADSANYELSSLHMDYTDTAVLDGQQRLTSLFLSLFGEAKMRPLHARKKTGPMSYMKLLIELNQNKLSIDGSEYNSKKFDIKLCMGKTSPTQFDVKNILDERYQTEATRAVAIEEAVVAVPDGSKPYARDILQQLYQKIFVEKLIRYTEILNMKQDDALEMFVRFNSGGKALRKSDITMSILEVYWPNAKARFGEALEGAYADFGWDFIVRAALMLYGDVVKSNISKKFAEELKNDWDRFSLALSNLKSLLKELKIEVERFSSSWNVLLPIVYYVYYNPEYGHNLKTIRAYLLRAIFFTYFQSGTTGKLQQMKNEMNSYENEITIEMLNGMGDLRVSEGRIEDVLNAEKGGRIASEVLYYLSLEWLNQASKYEQDHLHPDSKFSNGTPPVSVSIEDWKRWRAIRNRLPNLHLMVGWANASKSDMRLIDFYNGMTDEQKAQFLREAMIPAEVSLELENFDEFYEARKEMMAAKICELLG